MKIFVQFISSLVGGILLGIVGLIIGAMIGGNFGFLKFGGNIGYEAGGAFFGIIGISLGSLIGIIAVKRIQKDYIMYPITLIATATITIINLFLFDYNMPPVIGFSILLMPAIVLTVVANWKKFLKLN
jgi:hypothetical protein